MNSKRTKIEAQLWAIEGRFEHEMRARGFDPAQTENVALPSVLAKLYAQREELRGAMQELADENEQRDAPGEGYMSEIKRIEDQLRRAFQGGAWHGAAVLELLEDVTAQKAAARPIPAAHTIWEIVLHIAAWEGAGRRRLQGDRAQLPAEEDWPPITERSDEAWAQVRAALETGHRELMQAVARLEESRLDEPILEGMSSVYVTLQGVVQHDIYHAGQIAILKKAL